MKNLAPISDDKDLVTKEYVDTAVSAILPSVSSSDNGKVLQVVDGAWAAATIPSANGVNF